MFHAIYLNSSSLGFFKEDFSGFCNTHIRKINDPGVGQILTQGLLFE
jgi:hypothetical protein